MNDANRDNSISINVVIDALGFQILQNHEFLADLCIHRKGIASIFGFSSACLPSIYTGLYPDEHQRWGMWYYSPDNSEFQKYKILQILPEIQIRKKPISRYIIQTLYNRYSSISEYFSIYNIPLRNLHKYNLASTQDIYSSGSFHPQESIFDRLSSSNRKSFSANWRSSMEDSFRGAKMAIEHKDAQNIFIYNSEMDALLHKVGPEGDPSRIQKLLDLYSLNIQNLYQMASNKSDSVRMNIMSDHGMTQVRDEVDFISILEKSGLKPYTDYYPFYDSTMLRFNYRDSSSRKQMEDFLSAYQEYGKLMSDSDLRRERVYFPDHRYGETVFALKHGTVVNPSMVSKKAPLGMHGYLPDDPSCDAILISNYPIENSLNNITGFHSRIISTL
jgi:predicted AlkP superfamily pyrophosphatase or phosphodiesterase